ncbi:MAG: hypothetical protein R2788_09710 [Saprospiraceae bacterium]
MSILVNTVFALYLFALLIITFYCLLQLNLLFQYKKSHWKKQPIGDPGYLLQNPTSQNPNQAYPFVTIQLPIFNEQYVVERLIDNIMLLDYPKDRFEVHVLDDSTDKTLESTQQKSKHIKRKVFKLSEFNALTVKVLRQGDERRNAAGKRRIHRYFRCRFYQIKDFLKNTLYHLKMKKRAWYRYLVEHLNEDYSIITRLQALQLNVHFGIEQQGRQGGNYLRQFNGTAGVWRRTTIDDAGGWEADTLTEDARPQHRAQLKELANYLP